MNCFATVLGTAIFGERIPNLLGTVVCVVIMGVLNNGLTMIAVPYYYEYIIQGAVLIGAVALTRIQAKS